MKLDLPAKWFIRVDNQHQAIAAQEWAFEQGCNWGGKPTCTLRTDFKSWDKKSSAALGYGHCGGGSLGQAGADFWVRNGHEEIEVTFKLVVDKVVLPEISLQQKQIRELEATIALATQQIEALKKDI